AWRDPVGAHRRVAFVAGEPMLWPALTGLESLEFLARLRGGVDEGYRGTLIDRFEFDPRKRVRDYSKGNRQKIQLIAAFAARPDLLVLDEPTSGLDPLMEAAFRDTVAEGRLHQRVEAARRLVEDEQVGPGRERGDQLDLLAVALGVVADALARVELEPVDQRAA